MDAKLISDKKQKGQTKYRERLFRDAQHGAAKADQWLLPATGGMLEAEGMEETWRFKQEDIAAAVERGSARQLLDLRLPELGPYRVSVTRNGRFLALAGQKGHLALVDRQKAVVHTEIQVRETCRDVLFLHNEQYFAVAQKNYGYIYDHRGRELHCLTDFVRPTRLDFLPRHFLLTGVGGNGILTYQDTSTGRLVAQHKTKLGPGVTLTHNPWNAVSCCGHSNGTVTLWTPNMTTPVARMLTHQGPLRGLACDPSGHYLVTAGLDLQLKVWDVRTYQPVHAYFTAGAVDTLDISQTGLLAIGWGRRVQIWKDALSTKAAAPYLNHHVDGAGQLHGSRFVPYEDVLALGHGGGVSTLLVPGAGEANYDSWVADPYMRPKARQEAEVRALLDKIQPEMIVVDPDSVGRVAQVPHEVQVERALAERAAQEARLAAVRAKNEKKRAMKGKNKPTRRVRKKQENVIRDRNDEIRQRMKAEGKATHRHSDRLKREAEEAVRGKRVKIEGMVESVPGPLQALYRQALKKMV